MTVRQRRTRSAQEETFASKKFAVDGFEIFDGILPMFFQRDTLMFWTMEH